MAALMLPLLTEVPTEEKATLAQIDAILRINEDHKQFQAIRNTHQDTSQSTQTTKRGTGTYRLGKGHWVIDTYPETGNNLHGTRPRTNEAKVIMLKIHI